MCGDRFVMFDVYGAYPTLTLFTHFFLNGTSTSGIYTYGHTLLLLDALPICMTHVAGLYHFRAFARCAFRRRIGHFQPRLAFEYLARPYKDRCSSRSEEHTSELQSLMRNSYAVLCFNKKPTTKRSTRQTYL